jgi:hypothetical protein
VSLAVPIRPLEVIQQPALSLRLYPVVDAQSVDGLINAELASCPAEAFHAKKAVASGLTLLHAGVAMLIPDVLWVASGRLWRFLPAPTPFVRELNRRNGAQSIGDRELRMLGAVAATLLGEVVATCPSAARAEGMEGHEPGQPRESDIGLAVLPGRAGFVREVAEQATVRGEIGTPWEDTSTKPCAGLVPFFPEIPAAYVGPI